MKVKFRCFIAPQRADLCELFLEGHIKVLADYGIKSLTTSTPDWFRHNTVYVIVATNDDESKIYGGIRLHKADGINPLPLEKAIGRMDVKIFDIVSGHMDEGTGELCGLWNSKEVSGMGISLLLIRAGIAIVNQIKIHSLFTICADFTMPMVQRVGFEVENNIGNNGEFFYPNENYITRVLRKMNAVTLEKSEDYDRQRILHIRSNPIQIFTEQGPKGEVVVDYNLIFNS